MQHATNQRTTFFEIGIPTKTDQNSIITMIADCHSPFDPTTFFEIAIYREITAHTISCDLEYANDAVEFSGL